MNNKENIKTLIIKKPLKLDCGQTINDYPLAYETYGSLNENKDNAILVCHALTGDQFVTGLNPITKKEGWWSYAVGPNKSIDTNKYFVICANVIGGCMGSFGPSHINQKTKKIYGTDFPIITINDIVNAQINLLDHFEIQKLFDASNTEYEDLISQEMLNQLCANATKDECEVFLNFTDPFPTLTVLLDCCSAFAVSEFGLFVQFWQYEVSGFAQGSELILLPWYDLVPVLVKNGPYLNVLKEYSELSWIVSIFEPEWSF